MIDAKNAEKKHTMCPFSKLKSTKLKSTKLKNTKLKSSNLTACPFTNILIKKGHLDAKEEWNVKIVQDALKKIKISNSASFLLANIFAIPFNQNLKFSAKNISKPDVIEHPASMSREDFGKGNHINFSKKRFNLIYKYFPNKKYITLKELTEYRYFLYEKSVRENPNVQIGINELNTINGETCLLFVLLSKNDKLSLKKMRDVFEKETLDDVEIKSINVSNFLSSYIQFYFHWFNASLQQ
jgi:hypothetical protein